MKYKQCRFKRGDCYTIAYIDASAAKVGNKVQLLTLDGELWDVIEASSDSVTHEFVKENERNYKQFQGSLKGGTID